MLDHELARVFESDQRPVPNAANLRKQQLSAGLRPVTRQHERSAAVTAQLRAVCLSVMKRAVLLLAQSQSDHTIARMHQITSRHLLA